MIIKNYPLLEECLKALNAHLLPYYESQRITILFETLYPLDGWGKVEWDLIKTKKEIGDLQEIIPVLEEMLAREIDENAFLDYVVAN